MVVCRNGVVLSGIDDWVGLWKVARTVRDHAEPTVAASECGDSQSSR